MHNFLKIAKYGTHYSAVAVPLSYRMFLRLVSSGCFPINT